MLGENISSKNKKYFAQLLLLNKMFGEKAIILKNL